MRAFFVYNGREAASSSDRGECCSYCFSRRRLTAGIVAGGKLRLCITHLRSLPKSLQALWHPPARLTRVWTPESLSARADAPSVVVALRSALVADRYESDRLSATTPRSTWSATYLGLSLSRLATRGCTGAPYPIVRGGHQVRPVPLLRADALVSPARLTRSGLVWLGFGGGLGSRKRQNPLWLP